MAASLDLSPEPDRQQDQIRKVKDQIVALRRTMPSLTRDEIITARHEGHKY